MTTDTITALEFKTVPFDLSDPLDRLADETIKANAAFRDYVAMGPGRSLRELLRRYNEPNTQKPPTKHFATLAEWSTRFYWQRRLDAWVRLTEAELQKNFKERAQHIRQADYDIGQSLRDLAAKILAESPKFVKASRKLVKGEDGRLDREVVTLALDGHLMLKAVETASKLERQAAEIEEPARRVVVEVEKELQKALDKLEQRLDSDTFYRVLAVLIDAEVSETEVTR